jgi:hypothetical protein
MIYWALGPFVRSFILPVDPGDICPPHIWFGFWFLGGKKESQTKHILRASLSDS